MELKNKALQELYDTIVNCTITISPFAVSPFDTAFRECDEKLQKDIDDLLSRAHCAEDEVKELKKDLVDAKIQIKYFRQSRDDWQNRVNSAEEARDNIRAELEDKVKRMDEITKDRDSYNDLYTELKKDYDKLFEDNKKMKTRNDCLRAEVNWYRKHYKEQPDKIRDLKSILNSMYGVRKIGYEQGQIDLWDMLQNVNDYQPNELTTCFPDVTGMEDILSWNLEDFLDAYKKWQERKEKERLDHMRDYLDRFCRGRLCTECPLGSHEYKCGNGYSFRKFTDNDCRIIPDEELKRYYEKARSCGRCTLKNLANWECTFEAKVEINKDLLAKVCGVKPEEEEHKLEYGDAVRLSWSDYDYMYIGPDNEEGTVVRMFDPKNHAIATTHIGNVRYSGCKIILTSEDDLRKIWKDKK